MEPVNMEAERVAASKEHQMIVGLMAQSINGYLVKIEELGKEVAVLKARNAELDKAVTALNGKASDRVTSNP